jgi:protein phosphatase
MFKLLHYGETNVGRERKNNEDAFRVAPEAGVYLVCDGMGGHASGEIASQIAADAMLRFLVMDRLRPEFTWSGESLAQPTEEGRALDAAVRCANREVLNQASAHPMHKGMGTTVVAVLGGTQRLGLVHVGDSRVYRLRQGEFEQITDDHSLLNHYIRTRPMSADQIRQFAGKNVIVRAVGLRDAVDPEVQVAEYQADDLYLLCSDGLTDMVEDEKIAEILLGNTDLAAAGRALIEAALEGGGKDNITVLLLKVQEVPDQPRLRPFSRQTQSMVAADDDVEDDEDGDIETDVGFLTLDAETMPEVELPATPRMLAQTQPMRPASGVSAPFAVVPQRLRAQGSDPGREFEQEITERIPASAAQVLAWQIRALVPADAQATGGAGGADPGIEAGGSVAPTPAIDSSDPT